MHIQGRQPVKVLCIIYWIACVFSAAAAIVCLDWLIMEALFPAGIGGGQLLSTLWALLLFTNASALAHEVASKYQEND